MPSGVRGSELGRPEAEENASAHRVVASGNALLAPQVVGQQPSTRSVAPLLADRAVAVTAVEVRGARPSRVLAQVPAAGARVSAGMCLTVLVPRAAVQAESDEVRGRAFCAPINFAADHLVSERRLAKASNAGASAVRSYLLRLSRCGAWTGARMVASRRIAVAAGLLTLIAGVCLVIGSIGPLDAFRGRGARPAAETATSWSSRPARARSIGQAADLTRRVRGSRGVPARPSAATPRRRGRRRPAHRERRRHARPAHPRAHRPRARSGRPGQSRAESGAAAPAPPSAGRSRIAPAPPPTNSPAPTRPTPAPVPAGPEFF
jgi:hypothetical protein